LKQYNFNFVKYDVELCMCSIILTSCFVFHLVQFVYLFICLQFAYFFFCLSLCFLYFLPYCQNNVSVCGFTVCCRSHLLWSGGLLFIGRLQTGVFRQMYVTASSLCCRYVARNTTIIIKLSKSCHMLILLSLIH